MNEQPTVLVVDDDPDMIHQLTVLLSAEKCRVVVAGGKEEAEEILLTVQPDLAILDLMMERMDSGFVLAHHLRTLYPQTPILLLTGVASATGMSFQNDSAEAQTWLKAERVLDKPIRPEQLRAEVRRLLGPSLTAET